jgi:hypothetical protein
MKNIRVDVKTPQTGMNPIATTSRPGSQSRRQPVEVRGSWLDGNPMKRTEGYWSRRKKASGRSRERQPAASRNY